MRWSDAVLSMRVLLLFALLWVATVEGCVANLSVLWRVSALSLDNPATQIRDEAASQAVPHTDVEGQARDHIARALAISGRLAPPAWSARVARPALDSCLTRSPPTA